ncbi:MAG: PTS sugar transporter subunit IIB [Thermotaleaceae bacterium]
MIKVLRVDDRLLHGQVAVAWSSYLDIDTILIGNNKLITDQTMQIAFKLAKPADVILSMKSLDGAVEVINNPKHEHRKILVVVASIAEAEYLCKRTKGIHSLMIGGQRDQGGRKKIQNTVYLDEKDMETLEEIAKQGIEITLQAVPTSKKLTYEDIKNQYNT